MLSRNVIYLGAYIGLILMMLVMLKKAFRGRCDALHKMTSRDIHRP